MKAKILKNFQSKGREFSSGEFIEIPVKLFHQLSLKGIVRPQLPEMDDEEREFLRTEFERLFKEHFERLKKIPVTISQIKKNYPDVYEKLREFEKQLDEAFLSFDYPVFIMAIQEIEKEITDVANRDNA